MISSIRDRLSDPRPILLDGPTGTELTRRGVSTPLPHWSAGALVTDPDVVHQIHTDYAQASAEILTANTFRTHARNLRSTDWAHAAADLTRQAVDLARSAAGNRLWVAGSQAPLEDCYRPDLVPRASVLEREHAAMSEALAAAGVDLILVETHNCVRELCAATRAACAVGLPVLASVVCGGDGRLLSGESVTAAAEAVLPFDPAGVLVNCLPADAVTGALEELREVCGDRIIGAYANSGEVDPETGWIETNYSGSAVYAAAATGWVRQGARLIGGCCGTTPELIGALRRLLDADNP